MRSRYEVQLPGKIFLLGFYKKMRICGKGERLVVPHTLRTEHCAYILNGESRFDHFPTYLEIYGGAVRSQELASSPILLLRWLRVLWTELPLCRHHLETLALGSIWQYHLGGERLKVHSVVCCRCEGRRVVVVNVNTNCTLRFAWKGAHLSSCGPADVRNAI